MNVAVGFPSILALLLGLGGSVPLGVPPLAEDPVLARVAPEECLFYMSSSGTAAPDAKNPNQTEQLLAEPEVQHLIAEIDRMVSGAIEKSAGQGRAEQAAIAADAYQWGKRLLMRPAAAFVSSVGLAPQGPDVRGGLVINVGEDGPKLKATLEKYQAAVPGVEQVTVGKVECYRLRLGPPVPAITWGIRGKYLLAGVGEGSLEGILERGRAAPPQWLDALRKQLPVERVSMVTYVNVKKLIEQFAPIGGPPLQAVLDATGLGKVTQLASVTGMDSQGIVDRTFIGIDGEPAGVLQVLAGKPLTAKDLAPIPQDATIAVAARVDADQAFETFLTIASKIEPRARQEILRDMGEAEDDLGIKIREEVLKSLGDVWCVYNSPGDGGFVITGLTGVVQVKDRKRLAGAMEKLIARVKAESEKAGRQLRSPTIEQVEFAGQTIHVLNARDRDFPLTPAWCLTEKELIVAAWPQYVKAYLSRAAGAKTIAAAPEVAAMFESGGPVMLSYVDSRRLFDVAYPGLCALAPIMGAEMAREGIDLSPSILPSAGAIRRHLTPATSCLRRTAGGIEISMHQPLPGSGLATAAAMSSLLVFHVKAMPARPPMTKERIVVPPSPVPE